MRKHILYLVLVFCFVLGFASVTVHAAKVETSYTCLKGTNDTSSLAEGPEMIFDGKYDTKWCVPNFENAYIIFSTQSPVKVDGYAITTGSDSGAYKGRNPRDWKLYGCNEFDGNRYSKKWVEIHTVTNDVVLEDTNEQTYNFVFDGKEVPYRYYKLEITALQGSDVMQMSEFELTYCQHQWDEETSTTTPRTCTTAGYTETTCVKCNHKRITEKLIPYGHDFSENGECTRCYQTREKLYTFDVKDGKIEIRDDINGRIKVLYVTGTRPSEGYIDPNETITVTGNTDTNELHVYTQTPIKIKASGLSIDRSGTQGSYAFLCSGNNVTLILEGENQFRANKAGITVDEGRSLKIEGNGSLEAHGGYGPNSNGGAGIGGEESGYAGGNITIQGNVKIIADSGSYGAGIGDSTNVTNSKTSLTIGDGNPIIIASSISDHSNIANWKGLIFEGLTNSVGSFNGKYNGKMYGTTFNLSRDLAVESGNTLEIGAGKSLVIPEGKTLTNNGNIVNNGNLIVDGQFVNNGTSVDEEGNSVDVKPYYPLTVINGSPEGDIITNNGKSYAKAGSKITLKYTAPTGYKLSNWTSNDVKVTQSSFIMPASGVTVTANLEKIPEANKAPESTNIPAQSTTALRLQGTAAKTSIKMKWNAVPEADGYVIYGNNCSQKTVKQIGVVTGKTLSWTQKKLKKNSQNHYIVKAYKVVDGKQFFIQTSNEIHLVTKGGKYTNVKKLKSSASKVTLKKGKKKALKIKQTYAEKNKTLVKHMKSLSYTTSDQTVATVTKKGVVKAKGKGSCYIYITANSGVYTKVKVTVK